MRKPIAETARPSAPRPLPAPRVPRGWRLRVPRLGIGRRLGLGLAAVTTVLMLGEGLATRTTREALEAVRSMQNEDEPLANSANAVLEGLLAYDRAVDEDLQAHNPDQSRAMTGAGDALEAAVAGYFGSSPSPPVTASGTALRLQLTRHIASARELTGRAAQRAQWVAQRQAALNQVYQRITSAGGSGLAINGTQVVARRSLAELAAAMNAVRGMIATPEVTARRERDFTAVLNAHSAEFQSSPGQAWLGLVRQDFAQAARLRREIERYDAQSAPQWHSLREDSAVLTVGVQQELQMPARLGLLQAAQHAATATEEAQHTLRNTAAAVLGLVLLVSLMLAVSISVPVRRLTAATRRLAGGDRGARAPRGGSAEIDELAESFNTMADRIARAGGATSSRCCSRMCNPAMRSRAARHRSSRRCRSRSLSTGACSPPAPASARACIPITRRMPKGCCAPRTWRCSAPRSWGATASPSTVRRSTMPRQSAFDSSSRCAARSRPATCCSCTSRRWRCTASSRRASRRCCAGANPTAASPAPPSSSTWPRRPASFTN